MDFKYVRIRGGGGFGEHHAAGIFSMCWKLIQEGAMRVLNAGGEVLDTSSISGFGEIFGIS